MYRVLVALIVLPAGLMLVWLGLRAKERRADFVVAADGELRTIDPQRVSWLDEIQVAQALFEGLTRLSLFGDRIEPAVAANWDFDADCNAYTFHLRPGLRWSDGAPLTADDFRLAWLRVLDPRTQAQYATLLFELSGGEAYFRSRLDADVANDLPPSSVSVEAPDPLTLRVQLARPCPYFLELLTFPTYAPTPPHVVSRFAGANQSRGHAEFLWTRPGNLVCNGAFTLERWDFKQRLLLRRNPAYWDTASIQPDTIEILITGDPSAALVAYETGRVDLVRGLESSVVRTLISDQQSGMHGDLIVGDRFATFFLRVNCSRPPLDNADLRKALSLAVDKQSLCTNVLGLGEQPADNYVPPSACAFMSRPAADGSRITYSPPRGLGADMKYEQRVALARELLRRSGYERIAASRPIELAYAAQSPQPRIAEALQSMWESTLGIRVELRVQERKVLSSRIRALDYDLVRSDWYGDYFDPSTFLEMFTSVSGQNRTGWKNADYDRLIASALQEPDNSRRFSLFTDAERILCERELPIIPLYFKTGNYLISPQVRLPAAALRDGLPIQRARLARTGMLRK
ncbi:MAG: peptide ABC transporter substrate-binding protein [Phycisphaerae bacterium]